MLREFKNNAGTWSVERDYIHRDGTLLAAVTATGAVEHFHPDHLGTPRLITTTGAAYQSYHVYHPYGTEATVATQDTERMKFTGHERDLGITTSTADDLDYMHARFYNMQIGRFLGADGAESWKSTSPQTWNRYSYVYGNPLNLLDPDGQEPLPFALLQFYNNAFESDYSNADIQTGTVANWLADKANASAITLGNTIYMSAWASNQYENRSFWSLSLLGHELTHVDQNRPAGPAAAVAFPSFTNWYLTQYLARRSAGLDHDQAYEGISFEKSASLAGNQVRDFLSSNPQIRKKLVNNSALTLHDLIKIRRAFKRYRRLSLKSVLDRPDAFAGTGFVSADDVEH